MPTFNDPYADARETAEAVRGLAHATQRVEDPEALYPVIGELMAATRSLSQVLDQLTRAHQHHTGRAATDAGDREAGSQLTFEAAAALHEAAAYVGQADTALDRASNRAGRIAWRPENPPADRWVNVVFLQGGEADPVMEIIDRQGTDAAIEYLAGFDQGEDTIRDGMENGYVYDAPPQTPADRVATRSDYALTYSPDLTYVGLSRRIDAPEPEASTARAAEPPMRQGAGRHRGPVRPDGSSWFRPDAISEVAETRGLFR
ncbi:hypothetical protein KVA01_08320 [Kocuria varians]|uniref:Uncharacterized protein n=1 Tax=Kocuria varians TaxID=1272 RepID=A0A4Y4D5V9_KOCVA|nr:hypothetical protein [Kocuria varians]GEC98677.1 hypothetical protein KVA01_08320 [Kocuria varians]